MLLWTKDIFKIYGQQKGDKKRYISISKDTNTSIENIISNYFYNCIYEFYKIHNHKNL